MPFKFFIWCIWVWHNTGCYTEYHQHGRPTPRRPPGLSACWYSRPSVISSFWVRVESVICFYPMEYTKLRLRKTVNEIVLAHSVAFSAYMFCWSKPLCWRGPHAQELRGASVHNQQDTSTFSPTELNPVDPSTVEPSDETPVLTPLMQPC